MFWNAAWSTASQSAQTFRNQIASSKALPGIGGSLGRIALPVGIAASALNAGPRFVGGDKYGGWLELGAAGTATALGAGAGVLLAGSTAVFWVPVAVGVGSYYGIKTAGNAIGGRNPFDY